MGDSEVQGMAKAWLTKAEVYADIYKFQMDSELNVADVVETADEAFRKAFDLDMAAVKKPGRYKERVQTGIYNTAIAHFEQASANFTEKDFESAMENFGQSADALTWMMDNNLVKEGDDNPNVLQKDAWQNAALCAINAGDYDKAAGYYSDMIDKGIANDKSYANLASILISKSEFDKAKPVIDEGRKKFPDNESLVESELNYFIGTDQSDKAVDKLLTAIESAPDNSDLYFNLALAYDKLDKDDKMIETYEKIISMEDSYHGAYLNLGAYYNEKANDVIKTMNEMEDWREAVKLEPERDVWYNKAIPNLEKALSLKPNDEAVTNALIRIFANMNQLDKVKELKGGENIE